MYPYQTIDLGVPYHDPTSPLYTHSLRSARSARTTTTTSTAAAAAAAMTHASQLSPMSSDYFSHKPRSFVSAHSPFSEKLASPSLPDRGRTPARLLGYSQPSALHASTAAATSPRVPRSRTLLRLLVVLALVLLASLGWRCESVGCKGRGGGALVKSSGFVGGGGVVKGWGEGEGGVDLSGIWEQPSWGGERQGGGLDEESSTWDAFPEGGEGGFVDEEGELVGMEGEEMVEWDEEGEEWGGSVSVEERVDYQPQDDEQALEQSQDVFDEAADLFANDMAEDSYGEAYDAPTPVSIVGPVGEMTGPGDDDAEEAIDSDTTAQHDSRSDLEPVAEEDGDDEAPSPASLSQTLRSGVEALESSLRGAVDLELW